MRSMFLNTIRVPWRASVVCGASILLFLGGTNSFSQSPMSSMGQPTPTNTGGQNNKQLKDQIVELRAQVAKLQAAAGKTGSGR